MKPKANLKPKIPSSFFFKILREELEKENVTMRDAIKISFKRWEELTKIK